MQKRLSLFFDYLKLLLPYWDKSLFSFLCVGICVLLGMAAPLLTKTLIDYAYPHRDVRLLTLIILFGIIIFLFNTYFSYVSKYLDVFIHQSLSIDLRKRFFNKLLRLPLDFYYENQAGDILLRITNDIDSIVDLVAEIIPVVIKNILYLIFLLAICFLIDRNLTLIALIGVPIYFIETRFFAKTFEKIQDNTQKQESEVYNLYQEKITNIKTIKSFSQETHETERLTDKLANLFTLVRENLFFDLFNSFFDSILLTTWVSFLGWYAGYRVITGQISIGEIVAISIYLGQIHQPFIDLGAVYKFFVRSFVSINRVNAIFSSESEVYQDAHTFALNSIEGKINFDRVSFRYPGMDDYVLLDISFTANPGEITAIAGASGAGKSTIIDLILRFILPTDGKIYLDKYNIRDISLLTLRANISIVSQEAVMFSGTVRENLIYGCVQPTREKLIGAANDAEIHDFILSLPQGYDTLIGGGGKGLSGGQLQRLTIARALLCDVKILVLDEATSALDAVIEEKIYENLKKRISSKTVIMISHRISSLKNADKIHVVSENRISESGTYNELLERKGDFYSFYIASTKGEREPAEEAIIRELMAKKAMQKEKRNLEQLSMAEKKVLKLYYEEGLSYGKIAQELGLPAYNVSAIRKAASDKIERLKELEIE